MFWKRGLPKFHPQVLSRLATGECKQLQPWDPTTGTGWLGPHRADRWGWGGWAGLAGGGSHLFHESAITGGYCSAFPMTHSHRL